jgi:CarboxypepD_reg-like domain/TonB-dependent Receptor Plug Domain
MQKRVVFLFVAFLTVLHLTYGQPSGTDGKQTLNGYIKDASNGEALIGATIFLKEVNAGAATNVYGFYSITLPAGVYSVEFSYVGYTTLRESIDLNQNVRHDIELMPSAKELQEVVVTAEDDHKGTNNEMSTNKLDIGTIKKIPSFLGEVDVIRSLLMLPGVSTVGEGASGFNVRGGSVGQNLVLLDEAPVYNSSHMLGFFSVFNPDAVKDVKLYKGAIPVKYGGRISSILDVRMKEGNNKKLEVSGGIGTIFSRVAIEGPLLKKKASFIIAARRSYIDVLARPFVKALQNGASLNFYDLTAKVNYNINPRNRVYVSSFFGRDNFLFDSNQGFSWGNATGTLRWNHIFNQRLFSNLTALYSNYDYHLQFGKNDTDKFTWNSSISNYIFKPEFTYYINSKNELSFGAEAIYYTFVPANAVSISNGDSQNISLTKKYNFESALYVGNSQKFGSALLVDYGLRFSNFNYFGPGTVYTYNDTIAGVRKSVKEERNYGHGQSIANYHNWEPRASFKVQLSPQSSIKGSYNRMAQYLHLISNTTASNPLDVWNPSTNNIKPEIGSQYTVGYFKNLGKENQYEVSIEAYYKRTLNQIDYIDGADLLLNKYLEGDLLSGVGRAYGLEFFAQKKTGRFNGWVSYTLGHTELKVNGINKGNWYATRYDQRHNLKVAAFYDLTKRWTVSANFVFVSGTPTTFPTSRYVVQGILIPYNANDSRNNVRLPSYNRLDIAFRLDGRRLRKGKERKNHDYWVFSAYNVYARKNPFSIYFSQADQRTPAGQPIPSQASQLSIIGSIVPAISYNFNF